LLPEELQSSIVTTYGRGQIKRYADNLVEAVKMWRQAGVWRSKRGEISRQSVESKASAESQALTTSREVLNVISFIERRPMVAARKRINFASEPEQLQSVPASTRLRG